MHGLVILLKKTLNNWANTLTFRKIDLLSNSIWIILHSITKLHAIYRLSFVSF